MKIAILNNWNEYDFLIADDVIADDFFHCYEVATRI